MNQRLTYNAGINVGHFLLSEVRFRGKPIGGLACHLQLLALCNEGLGVVQPHHLGELPGQLEADTSWSTPHVQRPTQDTLLQEPSKWRYVESQCMHTNTT